MSQYIEQLLENLKSQQTNESIEKGAMSSEDIISKLKEYKNSNKLIIIEMNGDLVTTFFEADSWRGSYNLPAISYCTSKDGCTVDTAIKNLKEIDGMEVTGYKGGEFTLKKEDPLFIANYGDTNYCTAIVDITETSDFIVCLTKNDMY